MEQTKAFSPTVQDAVVSSDFDFFKALQHVKEGKKVSKREWANIGYYVFMDKEVLSLHKPDNKTYHLVVSQADMDGVDYFIV